MKVMIVVTHLLGTGHLARALMLGHAFGAAGDQVTVVSGGTPVPHFDTRGLTLVQLAPVCSDGTDFTTLLDQDRTVATAEHMQARQDQLKATLAQAAPDVLITELFPFGRRILRDEFRALLQDAHAMPQRPLILTSIRDILAPPGKPAKAAFADEVIAQFYDGVLVHADPEVVTLERSWPVSQALAERLHYTGFVAPPLPACGTERHGTILVSAGGGAVGDEVFRAALEAAHLMPTVQWHLLVGGSDARRASLAAESASNIQIDAPRADFRTLLQGAAASVSMCGYNTALDVLQTGVPAVLVPFDDGGEVEQGLRAEALSAQDGITILRQTELNGPSLVAAVDSVQHAPRRLPRIAGMDGAAQTVDIVCGLWGQHKQ